MHLLSLLKVLFTMIACPEVKEVRRVRSNSHWLQMDIIYLFIHLLVVMEPFRCNMVCRQLYYWIDMMDRMDR